MTKAVRQSSKSPLDARREGARMAHLIRSGAMTLADRFWLKAQKSDGCWEWQGQRNHRGYGDFSIVYKRWKAHRYSWFLANGSIPDGMKVLHRCDNTSCVRPDHLFVGTQKDNVHDAIQKGRLNFGRRGRFEKKS